MAHVGRIIHQRDAWKTLESSLTEEDVMLEIDWSENWNCKYSREIQGIHFGASHQQLALHTGFAESKDLESRIILHRIRGYKPWSQSNLCTFKTSLYQVCVGENEACSREVRWANNSV